MSHKIERRQTKQTKNTTQNTYNDEPQDRAKTNNRCKPKIEQ